MKSLVSQKEIKFVSSPVLSAENNQHTMSTKMRKASRDSGVQYESKKRAADHPRRRKSLFGVGIGGSFGAGKYLCSVSLRFLCLTESASRRLFA